MPLHTLNLQVLTSYVSPLLFTNKSPRYARAVQYLFAQIYLNPYLHNLADRRAPESFRTSSVVH